MEGAPVAESGTYSAYLHATESEAMKLAVVLYIILGKYIGLLVQQISGSFASKCLSKPVAKYVSMFPNILFKGSSCIEKQIEQD